MTLDQAFEVMSRPVVATSSVLRTASGKGMSAYEAHAEAAMLLAWCERNLTTIEMAYARYRFGNDRSGFELLIHYLASRLGTGFHYREVIGQVIMSYCGDGPGLRELRRLMGCGMLQAVKYRNGIYALLDGLHRQVRVKISTRRLQSKPLLA